MSQDEAQMHQSKSSLTKTYQITDRRNLRRSLLLRKREGKLLLLNYNHLVIASSSGTIIELEFSNQRLLIKGENLDELLWAISDHRLAYLAESPLEDDESADYNAPKVAEIRLFNGRKRS